MLVVACREHGPQSSFATSDSDLFHVILVSVDTAKKMLMACLDENGIVQIHRYTLLASRG